MIDDVPAAINFYTTHLGFSLDMDASPTFHRCTRWQGWGFPVRQGKPDGPMPAVFVVCHSG
jgi:hypothetical protein